jgi:hypothetical protein
MLEAAKAALVDGDYTQYNQCLAKLTESKKLIHACLKDAAPYVHSKLKSIEMSVDGKLQASLVQIVKGDRPEE